jgi:hypothetical protein
MPNVELTLAAFRELDKKDQESAVLDVVFRHDLGCTCPMCESLRTRYPMASTENADTFEKEGGCHQTPNFGATNTSALQSIARSLETLSSAVISVRDILRGRDSNDGKVNSPFAAIANLMLSGSRPAQSTAPSTQRAPNVQQAPAIQPTQAAQANPYAAAKKIATDQEMARFNSSLKVRFDPSRWPGVSHKGRTMLECEPDFLEVYADQIEYFAGKAKEKVAAGTADDSAKRDAQWGEKNAAQCRRLAKDMRAGKFQQVAVTAQPAYAGGPDQEPP